MEALLRDGLRAMTSPSSSAKPCEITDQGFSQRSVQTVIALASSLFERFLPRCVWEKRETGQMPRRSNEIIYSLFSTQYELTILSVVD